VSARSWLRRSESEELLDLRLRNRAQGGVSFVKPGEEGDEAADGDVDVSDGGGSDVAVGVAAGSAQEHPARVGVQELAGFRRVKRQRRWSVDVAEAAVVGVDHAEDASADFRQLA
jgi:hypothetical protein